MAHLIVNAKEKKHTIHRNIYGHFSEHLGRCIYGGLYVGEGSHIPNVNGMRTDVVEALRKLNIPVLRWPGGCFADEYHWKDGIGPKTARKKMVNTHWGGVVEDNSFGTHEFMELCRQLGCEPYINGNVGSGTVQEMSEWMEYLTFGGVSPMAQLREQNGKKDPWSVKYFGVGNENWGCGGSMQAEYYADLYRRFQTYVRDYGDNRVYRIACGANADDYEWTEILMKKAAPFMEALTLHYYTLPRSDWQHKGSALEYEAEEYYSTLHKALQMEELLRHHISIMQRHDPENKVGLIVDEWGTWYDVEPGTNPGFLYQQNTMRDALVAAVTLNVFNKNADRIVMANLAQTVNVLQAVILTEGDKLVLTPTYHVFDLYKAHQDAALLDSFVTTESIGEGESRVPNLHVSASQGEAGCVHITVANLSPDTAQPLHTTVSGVQKGKAAVRMLCGEMHAHNNFENQNAVNIQELGSVAVENETFSVSLPACSVTEIVVTAG